MQGIIYCITNLKNNKKYIGQTRTSLAVRYNHHLTKSRENNPSGIAAAIKKYGEDNFTVKEIAKCPIKELDMLEVYYIKKYNTYEKLNKNFDSLLDCADFLLKNNYPNTKKKNSVQRGISKALTGERKSYLGFHFKYL